MGRFRHSVTEVVVSVDDSKDYRFTTPWEPVGDESKKAPAKKAASPKKSD